ncbi:hypothetical protein VEE76_11840 [Escherichia coli]|nr:hypothetical protein VEE76_11840 [Escherichia coli]
MSEDYVIEWDKDFADDLNVVASVFSPTSQRYGLVSSLNLPPLLKSLKTKMKTNMDCKTFSIAVEAISEIMTWRRHFYRFYAVKD